MDNALASTILDNSRGLSTLPQTLSEVLRVARSEGSSSDDLAQVLMKDSALTAGVLRTVNSAFYGAGRSVSSVKQAVVTIGMQQVIALALSTSVYRMTTDWNSTMDRKRFWRHSLEVALAAKMIAGKVGYRGVEDAFVAGLLHDIGLLVLEQTFPEQFESIWNRSKVQGDLSTLEIQTWGTDHARVGQFLMEHWQLPDPICEAVGNHHSLRVEEGTTAFSLLSRIMCLAQLISKFAIAWDEPVNPAQLVGKESFRLSLEIAPDQLLSIEKALLHQTKEGAAYLEMDIGSSEDLIHEANRILFQQYQTVENLMNELRKLNPQLDPEDLLANLRA